MAGGPVFSGDKIGLDDKRPASARYMDISGAPLEKGDVIVVYDEATETKTTLSVEAVINAPTGRQLTVTLLESNAPNTTPGVRLDMLLEGNVPTMGTVIKKVDFNDGLDSGQLLDLYAVELYKWLMSHPDRNYRFAYREAIGFMVECNYFPRGDDYEKQKSRLRAIIRHRPNLMRSVKGGYIEGTGVDLSQEMLRGMAGRIGVQAPSVKRFKPRTFMAGLVLILQSGIFGEYVIENED